MNEFKNDFYNMEMENRNNPWFDEELGLYGVLDTAFDCYSEAKEEMMVSDYYDDVRSYGFY